MAPRRAQSCKELIQTDLHCSTAERENRKQRSRGERRAPSSLFLHSTGEYEHMISHMLHPLTTTSTTTTSPYTHADVRAHKSTVGCILDLPSPTSQPPLFKRPALTNFHIKRRLHEGPLKAPYRASNQPSPRSPPPSSQLRPLPRA